MKHAETIGSKIKSAFDHFVPQHQAFRDFMADIPRGRLHEIFQTVSNAAEVSRRPNASPEHAAEINRQISGISQKVGKDATSAIMAEVKERLSPLGFQFSKPHVLKIFGQAQGVRASLQNLPSYEQAASRLSAKLHGLFSLKAFSLAVGALLLFAIGMGQREADHLRNFVYSAQPVVHVPDDELADTIRKLEFVDVADHSVAAAIPMTVAAAAEAPVGIRIEDGSGHIYTRNSTVSEVYRAVPDEVKTEVERIVRNCSLETGRSITVSGLGPGGTRLTGFFTGNRKC